MITYLKFTCMSTCLSVVISREMDSPKQSTVAEVGSDLKPTQSNRQGIL